MISLLLLFGVCYGIMAQQVAVRRYGTQTYMRELAKKYPDLIKNKAAIERYTFDFGRTGSIDTITIAVVLHVFNTAKGKAIRSQDILRQLNRLTLDFWAAGGHPYLKDSYKKGDINDNQVFLHKADKEKGFARLAGQPLIQFCLPEQDAKGNKTTGIVYVNSAKAAWGMSDSLKRSDRGGSSPWDTKRYCNVWIVPLANGIAGYAQMPGGPAETDGIVLNTAYFAEDKVIKKEEDPYALGRTLVHLMGSYLNLYELWNDEQPCTDDYVEDTPIHNAPNHVLDIYQHVSTCDGNPVEMTMNFMDNTRDTAQYMFTYGQIMRMQATLAVDGPRHDLRKTPVQCQFKKGNLTDEVAERVESPNRLDSTLLKRSLQLQVIPNPTDGYFSITISGIPQPETPCRVKVFNETGDLVWDGMAAATGGSSAQVQLNGRQWPAGLYLVQALQDGVGSTVKVIIEH
jgi:Pregnancy-associated plasma protein-A/Secretion system C-terminal sorting domain